MVFTNLLENAAEAMQGGGTITIRGSAIPPDRVKIAITDSGPGIAPDLHERIFEFNFSQRTPGQVAQPRRLGFGLWWVKTLMTRLGGSVSVESDGCHGTTFWLSLPRAGTNQ
jgi:signal transduction histidine kinase